MPENQLMEEDFIYTPRNIHSIIGSSRAIIEKNTALFMPQELNTENVFLDNITQKTNLIYKTITSTKKYAAIDTTKPDFLRQNIHDNLSVFLAQAQNPDILFCFPCLLINNQFLTLLCNTKGEAVIFYAHNGSAYKNYDNAALNGAIIALTTKYPHLKIKHETIKIALDDEQDSGMISALVATLADPRLSLKKQIPFIKKEIKQIRTKTAKKIRQAHIEALTLYQGSIHLQNQYRTFHRFRANHTELLPRSARALIKPSLGWRFIGLITTPLNPLYALIDNLFQLAKVPSKTTLNRRHNIEGPSPSSIDAHQLIEIKTRFQSLDPWLSAQFLVQARGDKICFVPRPNVIIAPNIALEQLGRYFEVTKGLSDHGAKNITPAYIFHAFKPELSNENPCLGSICKSKKNSAPFWYARANSSAPTYFQPNNYHVDKPRYTQRTSPQCSVNQRQTQ